MGQSERSTALKVHVTESQIDTQPDCSGTARERWVPACVLLRVYPNPAAMV